MVDFDLDGRPDIILKSRMGPQVRLLQNNCAGANRSIAFRLTGTKSNRDAIGARITVNGQTKWLEAGSGFLSQHSKRVLFGLGSNKVAGQVRVVWPSGVVQEFANLEAGHEHSITEGQREAKKQAFREHRAFEPGGLDGNNEMKLQDTWFLEPVPLPDKQTGPGLFVLKEAREEYEIFRRYLFDWRAPLVTPFAMLLNASGDAVKVYAEVPGREQVDADLKELDTQTPALPYKGVYLAAPNVTSSNSERHFCGRDITSRRCLIWNACCARHPTTRGCWFWPGRFSWKRACRIGLIRIFSGRWRRTRNREMR